MLQLEAQTAGDQYNLVTAQSQYRQNILVLKQILQLPTATDFIPLSPDTLIAKQGIPSLLQAQAIAIQNRPEIRYNELQIRVAETELQKARAGYKPTISIGGSVSTGYSDNQDIKYFNQINNNLYQRLGATLSVPVFDNRINKTNVERSKILIEQARLTLEQTKTTLNQHVSVTERTKEIGLRMSISARGIDILMQFLIEAIAISITGGIIGVLFGLLASKLITVFLSWPTLVSESSIILSFVVCAITGIFFGYYPAQKASRLDPIEALRYE